MINETIKKSYFSIKKLLFSFITAAPINIFYKNIGSNPNPSALQDI